jgi:hypothetical protein
MAKRSPRPISAAQLLARKKRAQSLAKAVGFVGSVEYRHVYSQTGGAQNGRGSTERVDSLTIYAEAFERDADLGVSPSKRSSPTSVAIKSSPGTLASPSGLRACLRRAKKSWPRSLVP